MARDFLGLFRRSIFEARERLNKNRSHHRGDTIAAEDVNLASGSYGETKREEFQRDTAENTMALENAFDKIRVFCTDVIKKNIFLVDMDESGENHALLEELIDLRLIHQVKSRITTTETKGILYKAYLLDVSQYTGERAKRGFDMIDFWKENMKDKIRLKTMIYNPNWTMEEIQRKIKSESNKQDLDDKKNDDAIGNTNQQSLFD